MLSKCFTRPLAMLPALQHAVPGLVAPAPCVSFLPLKADDDAQCRCPIKDFNRTKGNKKKKKAVVESHTLKMILPFYVQGLSGR